MPSSDTKYLQLAFKLFDAETRTGKYLEGCLPINGVIPIPNPPKRDPRLRPSPWRKVDTIKVNGARYEVAIRRAL